MREIKFRGKYHLIETDETIWIYGCNDWGEIVDENDDHWRVDESTIGQYTGLKDDDSVKIFEGDVVSIVPILGVVFKGVVVFNTHTAAFEVFREELGDTGPLNDDFSIKVLGNIFDNPELKEKYWKHWDRRYYE